LNKLQNLLFSGERGFEILLCISAFQVELAFSGRDGPEGNYGGVEGGDAILESLHDEQRVVMEQKKVYPEGNEGD